MEYRICLITIVIDEVWYLLIVVTIQVRLLRDTYLHKRLAIETRPSSKRKRFLQSKISIPKRLEVKTRPSSKRKFDYD